MYKPVFSLADLGKDSPTKTKAEQLAQKLNEIHYKFDLNSLPAWHVEPVLPEGIKYRLKFQYDLYENDRNRYFDLYQFNENLKNRFKVDSYLNRAKNKTNPITSEIILCYVCVASIEPNEIEEMLGSLQNVSTLAIKSRSLKYSRSI